jgi:hypothetical protein
MNTTAETDIPSLDNALQALLTAHGYSRVLSRLVQIGGEHYQQRLGLHSLALDPRYLMTLAPEEREPFIKASVENALPVYEADRALPESERQLTADLETGDFHDYE